MAKRKVTVKHEPTDYHTAVGLTYNGKAGEYLMNIPARDLSQLDVVAMAARFDESVGDFIGRVMIAKNKSGESLYIIPVENAPKEEPTIGDKPDNEVEEQSNG